MAYQYFSLNNPGNIGYGPFAEQYGGAASSATDTGHAIAQFPDLTSGYSAMRDLLASKYNSGKTTLDQIIADPNGWTPGNHIAAANIAQTLGVSPDQPLNLDNPASMSSLQRALTLQETGTTQQFDQSGGARGAGTGPDPNAVSQARQFLATISGHADRPGDTSSLHPAFALNLASALQDASRQGLHLSLMSGFRAPGQLASTGDTSSAAAYDAAGNSSHSYGIAADIGGLDGANGPITQRWAQIAAAHGLSNPYGISNGKEFNHWQLLPYALETHPQQLAALKAASVTGDMNAVWNAAQPLSGGSPVMTAGGAGGAGVNPPTPASPGSSMLGSIGLALQNLPNLSGGGGQVVDPPDQPAIRTPALYAEAAPQEQDLEPSLGSKLGAIAPGYAQDTSITQGAPSMTGMTESAGFAPPATGVGSVNMAYSYPTSRFSRLG